MLRNSEIGLVKCAYKKNKTSSSCTCQQYFLDKKMGSEQ